MPEVPDWGHSPFPDDPVNDEMQSFITDVLDNPHAVEDNGHFEELVRLCRSTALKFDKNGHHDEAQKWRNYADRLNEAAVLKSGLADKLRAYASRESKRQNRLTRLWIHHRR